jgi:hypothetical protein
VNAAGVAISRQTPLSIVQFAATASKAPGASLRDQLRRPLAPAATHPDLGACGEDKTEMVAEPSLVQSARRRSLITGSVTFGGLRAFPCSARS